MRQTRWTPSRTQEHLNLVSCTWRHSSHTSHQKTSEASPDHVAVNLPLTSLTILHITTWIEVSTGEVLDLARARSLLLSAVPVQAILVWLKTFPQPSRVSDRPLHNWVTRWYFHITPRFQTRQDRSRHALNQLCSLVPPCNLTPSTPSVSLVVSMSAIHHMSVGPIQQLSVRRRSVLSDVADPATSRKLRVFSRPTHLLHPCVRRRWLHNDISCHPHQPAQ